MFKRYFMFFIVLLIPILFAFGVTYKVGTEASFPPFEYVENGQYVGFDIDLIKEIGKLKGFDVEVIDISFDSLIPSLTTGNIDIIAAGMTITEDRQKVVDFTIPYYSGDQSILVRKDSDFDITVLFGNHKIGVQTGTTGDLWVTEHLSDKNIIPKKNITRYDTFNFAVRDLVNKNIDAIVLDNPVAERFTKTDPVKIVGIIKTEESYGMAVKKGNKELLNLLNSGIQELQKNGKLDELIEKYFK
ncbi:MAG TPA: basic amino acid ABC transporter substrate-binding protein [Defluviitoga tunisiensis]|mgnify:CR=1 FL=1|jgi:polar amino acid transport system substrate-binding protein|nr:basic amino acid ABC transporter substrate-binding protein [Defluviitoga tunisiensis]MDY0379595.1 basic amino acid ABC transporter substrate-binding protein [Defluviitoga tunisiensis]HHV01453.1 basic amino acid ABC transporter substrate-binding protein [Defluviitoga tunisiensis]HOB55048.1 basic amino acid ABC transporter substrate-binding protein [Defluviitoga tunisiensis]HOK15729.1 basic amino acid ABC transporter substrate-binding protein [Defluviitoga tunisiensis]